MTMREFVKRNRQEINEEIRRRFNVDATNDEDRAQFVMNDEGLYNWAQSEGVPV